MEHQKNTIATFQIEQENFVVSMVTGKEFISKPFVFNIKCITSVLIEPSLYLGKKATLLLCASPSTAGKKIFGIITNTIYSLLSLNEATICFTLQPSLVKLITYTGPCAIVENSIIDITEGLLKKTGYKTSAWQWGLSDDYPPIPYTCPQFMQGQGETHFSWFQRLLRLSGISYFFNFNAPDKEFIVFCDHNAAYPECEESYSYIPLTGLCPLEEKNKSKRGFYELTESHYYFPFQFTLIGHNPIHPTEKIIARRTNPLFPHSRNWMEKQFYHSTITDQEGAERLATIYAERCAVETTFIEAESNIRELSAGTKIKLNTDSFHSELQTKDYIITEIYHYIEQATGWEKEEKIGANYHNKIKAVPANLRYRSSLIPPKKTANCFISHVESKNALPNLNQLGQQVVRHHFDDSDTAITHASPYLSCVTPYSAPTNSSNFKKTGWHNPLRHGTEVIISHLGDSLSKPIILGTLPNQVMRSPVTCHNKTAHRWAMGEGNELIMDDVEGSEKIAIQTGYGIQTLLFQNGQKGGMLLKAKRGKINFKSGKSISYHIQRNWNELLQGNNSLTIQNDFLLSSPHILQQSDRHYVIQAEKNIKLEAKSKLTFRSGKNFFAFISKDIRINSLNDTIQFETKGKNISIQANHTIEMTGTGSGSLLIGNKQCGIEMTFNEITVYGNFIELLSENKTLLQGQVYFIDLLPSPPNFFSFPPLKHLPDNPTLNLEGKNLHISQDMLTIHLNYDIANKNSSKHAYLQGACYEICSLQKNEIDDGLKKRSFTGVINKNSKIELSNIDLKNPFTIEMWYEDNQGIYSNLALFIMGIDNKPISITSQLTINPDEYKIMKKKSQFDNHREILSLDLILSVLHPPINFNFRLETTHSFNYLCQKANIFLNEEDIEKINNYISYYTPPKEKQKYYLYKRNPLLNKEQMQYIKSNNNNVTLFLHGYNVFYGQYGDQFELMEEEGKIWIHGKKQSQYNFIYRDPPRKILQDYENGDDYPAIRPEVNGTGAHCWWSTLSENLNVATKQFFHHDYSKYTTVIGIAWQGDPTHSADYMADVYIAKYPALLLAALIKQLLHEGVHVNIIAHSLGNLVLMHVLEILGKNPIPSNKINRVFMWEAAIPNTSFSREEPNTLFEKNNYYFPHALNAAERISVLYSQHDNILGPLQCTSPSDYIKQVNDKIHDPTAGWPFALMAIVLNKIDKTSLPQPIISVYHVANLLQKPLTELMQHQKIRENFYNMSRQLYPVDRKGHPLEKTLRLQVETLQSRYSKIFRPIAVFLAFYEDNWAEMVINKVEHYWEKKLNFVLHLLHQEIPTHSLSSSAEEVTAILITLFLAAPPPVPAMGYTGPATDPTNPNDLIQRSIAEGKMQLVPQQDWLTSHSGMRIPSDKLMKNVYERIIFGKNGITHYGKYKIH